MELFGLWKKLTLMDKILMVWSTSHEFTSVLLPSQLVSRIEHFHEEWKQDATGQRDEEQWQWYPQDQILQPFACRLVVKFSGIPPNLLGRALYVWVNSRRNSGLPVLDLVQDIFSIIYHPIVVGTEINVGLFSLFSRVRTYRLKLLWQNEEN